MKTKPEVFHSIPNPFPATTQTGMVIENERCYCGHLRSEHVDSFAWGHGACAWEECPCKKFTWREFIKRGEKT